ncbi:MAG: bifunctional DNA-formamidopyrimidine glycosylase/DNA-(apurinic or apyrimidinic site) lyase [Vicinamibacteria bacterium]|nr:bifunctional DNA-formamidopyrimidine glycosylase/DNA-(apurinic or apyrimidinic site) lyase [Vicinamibacteria bacterium]
MPELPEVEVTRRQVVPLLVGRRIAAVHTTRPSYFFVTPPATLKRRLTGRVTTAVARHGKYLLAALDDGARVLLHLGMTGQLYGSGVSSVRLLSSTAGATLSPEEQESAPGPDRHTHLRLAFDDGGRDLLFRDTRKFGKVAWLAPGASDPRLDKLGPDALGVDGALLWTASRRRTAPVKTLLLDQGVLAGVGNIYADEALFGAHVRPTRSARRLTRAECDLVAVEIRRVLLRSIETGGSSISDYVRPDGSDGGYQDERQAYARTGERCLRCAEGVIARRVIGGRSSHYCPRCQH